MDSGFVLTAASISIISSLIIQAMKKSQLAIFDFLGTEKNKATANFIFSLFVAFITSIGIAYKYDSVAGTLTISNLNLIGIQHGLWHWFIQWIGQHIAYKTWVVPQELQAANVDVLNQLLVQLGGKPK